MELILEVAAGVTLGNFLSLIFVWRLFRLFIAYQTRVLDRVHEERERIRAGG